MQSGFLIENRPDGAHALVHRPLAPDEVKSLRSLNVSTVEIVDAKGWIGGSIAFVREMDFIERLCIRSMLVPAAQLSSVESLIHLKVLEIATCCRTPIDFSGFRQLERCVLKWRKGCESLFDCGQLTSLVIMCYREPQLPIQNLIALERLQILDSSTKTLDFLRQLKSLRRMRLGALHCLRDTQDIGYATGLQYLDIDRCSGFSSILEFKKLEKLLYLCLNDIGTIESLQPLRALLELESVFFWGNTKVNDGRIEFLRELPRFSYVSFANRRHYDCKRESFAQYHHQFPFSVEF